MGICFSKAKKKKSTISRQTTEQPLQQPQQEREHHRPLSGDQEQKICSAIAELPGIEFTLSDKHVVENCSQEAPAPNPPPLDRTDNSSLGTIPIPAAVSSPHVLASLNPVLFEPRTRSSSPLSRSPSARAAHEATTHGLVRTLSIKAGLRSPVSKLNYSTEDSLCTPRSRSLPKRFYSRDQPELDGAFHKRSSSRDSTVESLLASRKSLRRIPSMDCRLDNGFSPRLSLRREEPPGDYRIYARHAAAGRNSHNYEHWSITTALDTPKSRRKEKSPLRRSSTGKVADADQFSYFQDDLLSAQTRQAGAVRHDHKTGRSALKDKSVNCSHGWDSAARQVAKALPQRVWKDERKNHYEESKKPGIAHRAVEEELFEQHLQTESSCDETLHNVNGLHPVIACEATSLQSSLHSSRSVMKANILQLASESPNACPSLTTKAVADMNLASAVSSETEDSDDEVGEDTFDLLQLALGPDVSPKMDLQAQQARNLLLKEAAMEAFARPRSHSSIKPKDLKVLESKTPGLSDLMASMRQKEAEADTLKIRRLLKLLSIAEPAMRPEQKTAFYSKLRMLLDSSGISDDVAEKGNLTNEGDSILGKTGGERLLATRVNSWPRIVKQPHHMNFANMYSVPINAEQALATEFLTNLNKDLNHDDKISEAFGNFPTNHDDLLAEPSLADLLMAERKKTRASKSQEFQLTSENVQAFVPATKNANEGKVLCLDLHTEHISARSLSDRAIEQPTNETNPYSIEESNVDIACPAKSPAKETERESFVDIDARKLDAQAVVNLLEQPRNGLDSHEDSNDSRYETTEDRMLVKYPSSNQLDLEDFNCESQDAEPKAIILEVPKDQVEVIRQPLSSSTSLVSERCFQSQFQPVATMEYTADAREDSIAFKSSSIRKHQDPADLAIDAEVPHYGIDAFLHSAKPSRPSDVNSDSSFEFRVKSNTSTPLSTPSTPMISTASTPQEPSDLNSVLTAEEIAEIWDAFECGKPN